uniref:Uncharacterized protein n=1 Tax=Arundo donax TaxID=35708 RepID=A0A0A9GM00_ARUDO
MEVALSCHNQQEKVPDPKCHHNIDNVPHIEYQSCVGGSQRLKASADS